MIDITEVQLRWFCKRFNKKTSNTKKGTGNNSDPVSESSQSPQELHKPIIRKFEKREIYSFSVDNIWGADIVDMQLTRKVKKSIQIFVMCSRYLQ